MYYFEIAVNAPINGLLTYKFNEDLDIGTSVKIPLGKRTADGLIISKTKTPQESFDIKNITHVIDERPVVNETILKWLTWLSRHYVHPIGLVAQMVFPPLKKEGRKSKKNSPVPIETEDFVPKLTESQNRIIDKINSQSGFKANLLWGVTGSGKTEIYMNVLKNIINKGQCGIVLVPEISLTPQLIKRFSARFPNQIAVIHSHLTPREKTDQWWSMVNGSKKILIGARSALFCPISNLGLIVVDEEHEPSFKQDEQLKYHGRDSAVMLAHLQGCPIILGSATPSMESWNNSTTNKYELHKISSRISDKFMPEVSVVNLKNERQKQKEENSNLPYWLSKPLYEKLVEGFQRGEQSALFLNRRGIAQSVFCPSCGTNYECPNCSISLTLHGSTYLVCHYCEYREEFNFKCKECSSNEIGPLGVGTEKIEQDLRELFPEMKIARADRDEIQNRKDMEELIFSFEKREIDLLIGTQMIAKGLDFPGLTTVGLVLTDVGFHLPDFRATERSFQLIVQVAGRAGRHSELPGQVIIQTYDPKHPSITYGLNNDFLNFADNELSMRKALMYPPFGRLACFKISGLNLSEVENGANALKYRINTLLGSTTNYSDFRILGPAPSPISKLRGNFRFQILVKSPENQLMSAFCNQIMNNKKWMPKKIKIHLDVDPVNLL